MLWLRPNPTQAHVRQTLLQDGIWRTRQTAIAPQPRPRKSKCFARRNYLCCKRIVLNFLRKPLTRRMRLWLSARWRSLEKSIPG
jgi:hypothetical protein